MFHVSFHSQTGKLTNGYELCTWTLKAQHNSNKTRYWKVSKQPYIAKQIYFVALEMGWISISSGFSIIVLHFINSLLDIIHFHHGHICASWSLHQINTAQNYSEHYENIFHSYCQHIFSVNAISLCFFHSFQFEIYFALWS